MIKSQVMRWTEHEVHMGEKTNAYRGMVKKPDGKRSLRRPRNRMGQDSSGTRHAQVVGSCEHRNAHSSSIKCKEFLD